MTNYILPILIFSPVIMAIIILSPLLKTEEKYIRRSAKIFAVIHFILITILLSIFDFTNMGTSYESTLKLFNSDWMDSIGISACFALNPLSMLFILLTSFIFLISIFLSKNMIKSSYQLYYSMLLLLESAILGIFCAKDMFLFFLFWELELIPMYILLLKWGSANKEKTASKFILYTFTGSIFIFIGILMLYLFNFINCGILSSDFYNIDLSGINENLKYIIFICFLIGFGIKLPLIPFHSWLPDAHTQAATPVSIILSSVLLKIGAYGILKFNVEILNDIFCNTAIWIMLFALINIIYGSLCAAVQKDLKKIIAYSGIANMGIFLFAISALNETGFTGGIFQLFSHALISAGLFTIAGIIYIKCGTKNILRLQGLGEKMPVLFFISTPIILAAAGVPLFSGFVSEFLCFAGTFPTESNGFFNPQYMTIIAIFSIIISGIYILKFFHGIFFSLLPAKYKSIRDINIHQKIIITTIVVYIIYLGVFPSVLTNIISEYSIITYDLSGVF